MDGGNTSRSLALALGLAALPGCSWLFVEAPPTGHERLRYFDCSTSRAAPIIDVVFASLYGLSAVMMVADGAGGHGSDGEAAALAIVPAGVATLFGVSAAHGFGATSDCDEAKARWAERTLTIPPPAPSAPRTKGACGSDADCAGDRICEQGACVFPPEPIELPGPTVPAAPAAPPEPTVPATPNPNPSPNPSPSTGPSP